MWRRLRARAEWRFFAVLPKADPRLSVAWWLVLLARGLLPAGFAVATGLTVGAVEQSTSLVGPLLATGLVFVAHAGGHARCTPPSASISATPCRRT